MARFTIENADLTAKFELYHDDEKEFEEYDSNFQAILRYQSNGWTVFSENKWELTIRCCPYFVDKLKEMYSKLEGVAHLNSEWGGSVTLTMRENGIIDVEVRDGHIPYSEYVQFGFSIDQSYLPDLIRQAEELFRIKEKKKSILSRLNPFK
ncbi:MAG: hypothetical protein J5801_03880 [Bacteroidales bacterium]|nr:hypothetical protein [Bacteroidales bacterium]